MSIKPKNKLLTKNFPLSLEGGYGLCSCDPVLNKMKRIIYRIDVGRTKRSMSDKGMRGKRIELGRTHFVDLHRHQDVSFITVLTRGMVAKVGQVS